MEAYLVSITFLDGSREGVVFTDQEDADLALSGECGSGSSLAVEWSDLYGDSDLPVSMQVIDI